MCTIHTMYRTVHGDCASDCSYSLLEILEFNDRAGRVQKKMEQKYCKLPSVSFVTILQSQSHASS